MLWGLGYIAPPHSIPRVMRFWVKPVRKRYQCRTKASHGHQVIVMNVLRLLRLLGRFLEC